MSVPLHRRLQAVLSLMTYMASWCLCATESPLEKTTVTYKKVNGHGIFADIYRPRDDRLLPVIVYLHGGALIMGNREMVKMDKVVLHLAEQKRYAVVSIDYRLAPETKLPEIINDIEAAFAWLGNDGVRQFHIDPQRMVVVGASAGGYLALVTGYRVSPRPRALVALFGYGELNADSYAKPNPYPNYNAKKYTREEAMKQTDGGFERPSRRPETIASDLTSFTPHRDLRSRAGTDVHLDGLAARGRQGELSATPLDLAH